MSDPVKVIIIRESVWQSIVSDTCTVLSAAALIGVGWFLGSVAMEWAGFLLFGLFMIAYAGNDRGRRTPQEVADYLRDEFGVVAQQESEK